LNLLTSARFINCDALSATFAIEGDVHSLALSAQLRFRRSEESPGFQQLPNGTQLRSNHNTAGLALARQSIGIRVERLIRLTAGTFVTLGNKRPLT
jgi:hypothetical protein